MGGRLVVEKEREGVSEGEEVGEEERETDDKEERSPLGDATGTAEAAFPARETVEALLRLL